MSKKVPDIITNLSVFDGYIVAGRERNCKTRRDKLAESRISWQKDAPKISERSYNGSPGGEAPPGGGAGAAPPRVAKAKVDTKTERKSEAQKKGRGAAPHERKPKAERARRAPKINVPRRIQKRHPPRNTRPAIEMPGRIQKRQPPCKTHPAIEMPGRIQKRQPPFRASAVVSRQAAHERWRMMRGFAACFLAPWCVFWFGLSRLVALPPGPRQEALR